jgi:hypothetical protein
MLRLSSRDLQLPEVLGPAPPAKLRLGRGPLARVRPEPRRSALAPVGKPAPDAASRPRRADKQTTDGEKANCS